jgi:hypothetical protein
VRPSLRRAFSRSEGRLFETARLLYVPGIVMAVSHSVFDVNTAYSHHDVYLYPAKGGGGGLGRCVDDDKYAYLRSRKMSSKCNFELRILDSLTEPLTINARLDVLHGLFAAVHQAELQKKNPGCLSPGGDSIPGTPESPCVPPRHVPHTPLRAPQTPSHLGPTPLTLPPSGLRTQVKRNPLFMYPTLEPKEKSTLTVFSIMRHWDVQVSLGRIILCSWPSKNALSGVVLTLAGLDMQLRLLREVPLDYRSKGPFFANRSPLSTSPPSESALSPASMTPFSLLFPTQTDEPDRTHRPSLSPINETSESVDSPKVKKSAKRKDRGVSVTFAKNTRGGLPVEDPEDDPESSGARKHPHTRKRSMTSAPGKGEKDKERKERGTGRNMSKGGDYEEDEEGEDIEDDEDFPLQVEHLFTEIHFAEIYARDWTVSQSKIPGEQEGGGLSGRSSSSSSPMAGGSFKDGFERERETRVTEPCTVSDLQQLFTPLCKLAHASRVVVSLTDDGEVAGKLDTFETVGLLPVSHMQRAQQSEMQMSQEMVAAAVAAEGDTGISPRLHQFIGKERRKSSLDTTDATRIKYLQTRFSASPLQRTASSRQFVEGDNEMSRKFSSLSLMNPSSLFGSIDLPSCNTPLGPQSPRREGASRTPKEGIQRENSTGSSNSASSSRHPKNNVCHTVHDASSSFGNKIWGLRVVDMRLLMTIAIRDSVFGYVSRCFEFFKYDVVVSLYLSLSVSVPHS